MLHDNCSVNELNDMKEHLLIEMSKGGTLKELGDMAEEIGVLCEVLWYKEEQDDVTRTK